MIASCPKVTRSPARPVGQVPGGLTSGLVPESIRKAISSFQARTGQTTESLAALIASDLGRYVHPRTLYRWQEEAEAPTHPVPLDAAISVSRLSGDFSALQLWAHHTGHACIRLPAHAPVERDIIPEILKAIREAAEAVEESTRAVQAGPVTDQKLGRCIREIAEAQDQFAVLQETLVSLWRQGRAKK